jgi:hypothetical protein
MRNKLRSLVLALVGSTFGLLSCARASEKMPIDVHRAIEIADGAVTSKGIDRSSLELVTAKQLSVPFNEVVPQKPTSDSQRALAKKLDGRSYWYVYYVTRAAEMGGDIGIFVDAKTGEVIDIYRGR